MDNQRSRYLSEDEETRLMTILVGRRSHLRPVVILALRTGMRRGEILSLRWNQIDFGRGLILVQRTKTGRDRIIPMNSTVRETLAAIHQRAEGDQVFPINDVKHSFSYACVKAKIADFRFHDLRHTAATRLAHRGADAFQIAAILGHSSGMCYISSDQSNLSDSTRSRRNTGLMPGELAGTKATYELTT